MPSDLLIRFAAQLAAPHYGAPAQTPCQRGMGHTSVTNERNGKNLTLRILRVLLRERGFGLAVERGGR